MGGGGLSIYVMEELVLSNACQEPEQSRKDTVGGGGEERERAREREMRGRGQSLLLTHMYRNTLTPLPQYSHIHAMGKQQKL